MTNQEFSNEFDILYNNVVGNQAPGLDPYEKSVFLTKAQEDVIISLYKGNNPYGTSFEETEELRRCLNELIRTATLSPIEIGDNFKISKSSAVFELPREAGTTDSKVWFIIYEAVNFEENTSPCKSGEDIPVIPVTHDEYHRIKANPFKGANNRRVLRLDLDNNKVELVTKNAIASYFLKYIEKPTPIILINLPQGLSIDNTSNITQCKLNPLLHRAILERAVNLAASVKMQ